MSWDLQALQCSLLQVGSNQGDQAVSKVNYTLDTLIDKYETLQEKHDSVQGMRNKN